MAGAHSQKGGRAQKQPPAGHRGWLLAITLAAVAVVAVGVAAVAMRGDSGRAAASPTSAPAREIDAHRPRRSVPGGLGDPRRRDDPGAQRRHHLRAVLRARSVPTPRPRRSARPSPGPGRW